jgi:AAA ATPase domain
MVAVRTSSRPFVGRAQELAELASALDAAEAGRGSLVLLTGEPGIGKTRLMGELAQLAAERGARMINGRCWEEGGAPPYWPWIQVLRTLGGDFETLVTRGAGSGVMPEADRIRLFDAVAVFLADASLEQPLVVALDDVHAGDEPSLLLLRFLGDALAEGSVLLVASYREREPRVRELANVFAELTRVGTRLGLRGLSRDDVGAYVTKVTGTEPQPAVVDRLHEITGGNPFFVGEVVRLVAAGEKLEGRDNDPLLRIPEEVRALIRRRVAGLPTESVGVLRIASVIGREFDLQLLQSMSRLTPARLLDVLQEAVDVGVVSEVAASPLRYSFAHELVRETLYDDLPPARRFGLHDEVGRLLESVYANDLDPHLSEIARHLYLAAATGDAAHALDYLVRAGDRASALFAYEAASVHYRRALELLALVGDTAAERRSELLLRFGDAQWRSGNGTEARITFEEAIECGRRLGDGDVLARAAVGYVTALGGFLLYARFEVGATGIGLLEEALAALPSGDSTLRARLLAHLALEMWSGSEPVEQRVAVSQDAIDMARRLGDSGALVTALHARHWVLTTPGHAHERLMHTEEMLRVAKATVNPEMEFLAHNARFHCFLELCDRRGMDAESQAMTELAERLRQPFYRWHTVCLRALRATLDGRFADAERWAHEALEVGELRQSEYASYVFRYAQMLTLRWAQGRLDEIWPELDDHSERFPWIPQWRNSLAAAELGDEEAARSELERHAGNDFDDLPRDGLWVLHVCSLAEACVLVGDRTRAERLYELLLPHPDDNAVSYTQQPFGPVALRLGKLAAMLGRWNETDRHFGGALARCELLGARAIRVRVLLEYAKALADRGEPADRGRLESMLDEVVQLAEELDLPAFANRAAALRGRTAMPDGAVFRREGDVWTIGYAGQMFRLRDVKGLGYIAALLSQPGRELHVLELVGAAAGSFSNAHPLLDDKAKRAYARRLVDLEEELDQARDWGDVERVARLEGEVEALTLELTRATGLAGRDRTFATPAERARVSVTKAIKTAIRLIEKESPELGAHLQASIQTGRFCAYATPGAAPLSWSV